MISSFFSDCQNSDEGAKQSVLHRLMSTNLIASVAEADVGLRSVVDSLLDGVALANEPMERSNGYILMNNALCANSDQCIKVIADGRMTAFIDRFPTLFERMSATEVDSFLTLFSTLLDVDGCSTGLSRSLPKLIGRIARILKAGNSNSGKVVPHHRKVAGILILTRMARSSHQTLLLPHTPLIKAVCVQALGSPDLAPIAAEQLALCLSLETPEAWTGSFLAVSERLVALLSDYLGVQTGYSTFRYSGSKNKGANKETSDAVSGGNSSSKGGNKSGDPDGLAVQLQELFCDIMGSPKDPNSPGGATRALQTEGIYRGLCFTLQAMLHTGCTSGAASLDLSAYLPLLSVTLSLRPADGSLNDPKALIPSACGVSHADVCLVSAQLKLALLGSLGGLLETRHPSLIRVGPALARPLGALLAGPEVSGHARNKEFRTGLTADGGSNTGGHPGVARAALRCAGLAASCLPSVVGRGMSAGVEALVQMLQREMQYLCTLPSIVRNTKGATGAGELVISLVASDYRVGAVSGCAAGSEEVLLAVEQLLLFSAPLLPSLIQDQIEYVVASMLRCLSKGVLPAAQKGNGNKHLNREESEPLRCSSALQACVLRLGAAEAAYVHHSGLRSANTGLLKKAAQTCVQQAGALPGHPGSYHYRPTSQLHPVYNHDQDAVAVQAARVLLVVEALLNPCAAPLALPDHGDFDRQLQQREAGTGAGGMGAGNSTSLSSGFSFSEGEGEKNKEKVEQGESSAISSDAREAGQAGTTKTGRRDLKREAQEGTENPHLKSAKIGVTSAIGSVLVQKEEEEEEEDEEDEEDGGEEGKGEGEREREDDEDNDDDDFSLPDIVM